LYCGRISECLTIMINVEVGWVLTERRLYEVRCGENEKIDRETKRRKEKVRTKAVIRGPEVSEQGMLVPNEIGSDHAGQLLGPTPA